MQLQMTIDQAIALSASIGAFLSAIAAFLAVRQNTKSREASYRPELAITKTSFMASTNPISKSSFGDFWREDRNGGDDESIDFLPSLTLPLRNVGLGAAKEVALTWSFPIADLVQTINDKAQRALIPAYFEFDEEILSLKSEQLHAATSMWGNQRKALVDYVLPSSSDREGVGICVPHAYMGIVAALVFFSQQDTDRVSPRDLPALRLDIEYSDIGGAQHKASFTIELNLVAVQSGGAAFHGYMQSRKRA